MFIGEKWGFFMVLHKNYLANSSINTILQEMN